MTVAAEPTFLDTNILVYASVDASPFHAVALSAIAALEQQQTPLWISRQIIREYLATQKSFSHRNSRRLRDRRLAQRYREPAAAAGGAFGYNCPPHCLDEFAHER